jgi:alpha-glucuronidase
MMVRPTSFLAMWKHFLSPGIVARAGLLLVLMLAPAAWLRAETGYDAWLRYAHIDDKPAREQYAELPATVVALGKSPVVKSAQEELIRGLRGLLGRTLRAQAGLPKKESAILLGTFDEVQQALPAIGKKLKLAEDGFWLNTVESDNANYLVITAANERGVLYGTFGLLRKIALGEKIESLNERQSPYAPLRVINQWDRLDGTVERSYAGKSIFWDGGHVAKDLGRAGVRRARLGEPDLAG